MMRLAIMLGVFAIISAIEASSQNAADSYYDPTQMAAARSALKEEHGSQSTTLFIAERLEYQSNEGDPELAWEGHGWAGGDLHKLWFKSQGEYATEEDRFERAEVQALYSRAVSPFWDLQAGIRHDIKPDPSRTYAAIGVQGLAPYWFELDGAFFLSNKGDLSARLQAEYDIRLGQRLILQPRVELDVAFSDDDDVGLGSGLSEAEAGLRLRYEITREFTPYVGLSWARAFGDTADIQRDDREQTNRVSFVAGIRFWF